MDKPNLNFRRPREEKMVLCSGLSACQDIVAFSVKNVLWEPTRMTIPMVNAYHARISQSMQCISVLHSKAPCVIMSAHLFL
jgi:hypothetical protein